MLIGVISLSTAPAASAQPDPASLTPPRRAGIPKLEGSLKMDGRLDEAVWQKAAVLSPFTLSDGSGPGREQTEVRVWYDDEALYLGWTCWDKDIQATFTERDSKFWEEEVAEFFITPGRLDRYFELQWNPLGGVFDAIIENEVDDKGLSKRFQGDWDFTASGMTSAVHVIGTVSNSEDIDELWRAEVRIPFTDFNHPAPKPNDIWRANFYRYNRGKGQRPDLLSWSPTLLPGFHQPARFGYLEFKGKPTP